MDIIIVIKQKRLALVTILLCACIHTVAIEREPEPLNNGYLHINLEDVLNWSSMLSARLLLVSKTLTDYTNIASKFQHLVNKNLHHDALVDDIAQDFEVLLKSKLKAVMDLVEEAERVYKSYTYDVDLDFDYLNSKTSLSEIDVEKVVAYVNETNNPAGDTVLEMVEKAKTLGFDVDKKFKNMVVNHYNSTVHVPTNVYDRSPNILNGAYWTQMLDAKFRENNRNKSLRWQYFCSSDGFFRVYPGMKWPRDNDESGTDMYDCRVRSWYLQAATCPKNVLILLDTSGSMKGSRMVIARSTVKAILNTLDDDDYFNIIRFSDKIEYIDPCFDGTMMQATAMNKHYLQELIDLNVTAQMGADFRRAFDTAFFLLNSKESKRSPCNKAILLITDGVPEHYDEVFKHYTNNFTSIQTRVFTFLIGREVDDDREVRWMACANKGYYSHISTLADVQENVQNYIKVMSRPMVIKRYHNKIWTSIYLDHMSKLDKNEGLQFMTSVAIPVFDTKKETFYDGNLLGVMGTDVPVASLQELVPIHKLGANGFAFLINHNGYVLMHPDYKPFRYPASTTQSVLNPYYNNIDLNDVTQPVKQAEFKSEVRMMLSENNKGSGEVMLKRHYDKMRRMVKRNYRIFYRKVNGTDFRVGIALPSTSLKTITTADSITSVVERHLNESNLEIAPWLYCKDLDTELHGKARINAMLEILRRNPNECERTLLSLLSDDAERLQQVRLNEKWSKADSNDIPLIFIGTRNGLTRYLSANDSFVPPFILNNTDTLNAEYYIRAVEAVEDLVVRNPRYLFTYSVSLDEQFNSNTSVVTASAPIYNKNKNDWIPFVHAVVGFQMEYQKFAEIFMVKTSSVLKSNGCRNGSYCSCQDKGGNCYLVDNHGYVVASKDPDNHVGLFFGDIHSENKVMQVLVENGLFTSEVFTDYQAICEKESEEETGSAAPNLLNPIKAFLNGLLWTITELILFTSEFSLKSLWFSFGSTHSAQTPELSVCESMIEGEVYETLGPMEKLAYSQVCPTVVDGERKNKPCHKTFKLYRADFSKTEFKGEIDGEFEDMSGYTEGEERAPVMRNSSEQMCTRRKKRQRYGNKKTGCIYDYYAEETKKCGVGVSELSTKVLLISLCINFVNIFVRFIL